MTETTPKTPAGSPAERILEVASELFYSNGYRATGINEIIDKSGVAKATFYSHFKTKDDLCQRYLQELRDNAQQRINAEIGEARGALNKFLAPMRSMQSLMEESNFRGCAFMNIASEMPDCGCSLRREGIKVYDSKSKRIRQLADQLIQSDPDKYGALDPQEIADKYVLVLAGAVALAELYGAPWPLEQGLKTIRDLVTTGGKH